MLWEMKKFLVDMMIRLSYYIHQWNIVGNSNKSYESIFPFDESLSFFSRVFFFDEN